MTCQKCHSEIEPSYGGAQLCKRCGGNCDYTIDRDIRDFLSRVKFERPTERVEAKTDACIIEERQQRISQLETQLAEAQKTIAAMRDALVELLEADANNFFHRDPLDTDEIIKRAQDALFPDATADYLHRSEVEPIIEWVKAGTCAYCGSERGEALKIWQQLCAAKGWKQ